MKKVLLSTAAIALGITLLPFSAQVSAQAATLTVTDFDQLVLGAKIVGPVGPEVETTFLNDAGDGIGDLSSSVSCPAGFAACVPPENPAGTIYTYVHEVTPGVDLPNDAPFPNPAVVIPVDDAAGFRLNFVPAGFNGVVGYSVSEAEAALGAGNLPAVSETLDGNLVWRVPDLSEWNQGEKITFFWQTTQNPSGPGGSYGVFGPDGTGSAAGPLPTPIASTDVPEPGAIAPLALLSLGLLLKRPQKSA
ncbi:MAG: exosortase, PEP-CTERM interaction domain protein [Cyanobacteria bacterium J06634_6]